MSLKDEWKETGKNLGSAMSDLGKSIGKSADTIVHDKKTKTTFLRTVPGKKRVKISEKPSKACSNLSFTLPINVSTIPMTDKNNTNHGLTTYF